MYFYRLRLSIIFRFGSDSSFLTVPEFEAEHFYLIKLGGVPKLYIFKAQGFYACFNKEKIVTLKNAIQMSLLHLSVI